MRRMTLATLSLLFWAGAAWAETFYVVGKGEEAVIVVNPATIQDIGSSHKVALVNMVDRAPFVYVYKQEFDCSARRSKIDSLKVYTVEMELVEEKEPADWMSLPPDSLIEDAYAFICRWPQVGSHLGKFEASDLQAVVGDIVDSLVEGN